MKLEDFTIRQIREFQKTLKGKSIKEWKITVSEFRDEHELNNREAIAVANYKVSSFITSGKYRRVI